jgi:hypothetical protein
LFYRLGDLDLDLDLVKIYPFSVAYKARRCASALDKGNGKIECFFPFSPTTQYKFLFGAFLNLYGILLIIK